VFLSRPNIMEHRDQSPTSSLVAVPLLYGGEYYGVGGRRRTGYVIRDILR